MAKYLCTATVSVTHAGGSPMMIRKGQVVDATSSQITAWDSASFRLMNNPGAGTQTVSYGASGGTLTTGSNPGSVAHDTNGEAAGASS